MEYTALISPEFIIENSADSLEKESFKQDFNRVGTKGALGFVITDQKAIALIPEQYILHRAPSIEELMEELENEFRQQTSVPAQVTNYEYYSRTQGVPKGNYKCRINGENLVLPVHQLVAEKQYPSLDLDTISSADELFDILSFLPDKRLRVSLPQRTVNRIDRYNSGLPAKALIELGFQDTVINRYYGSDSRLFHTSTGMVYLFENCEVEINPSLCKRRSGYLRKAENKKEAEKEAQKQRLKGARLFEKECHKFYNGVAALIPKDDKVLSMLPASSQKLIMRWIMEEEKNSKAKLLRTKFLRSKEGKKIIARMKEILEEWPRIVGYPSGSRYPRIGFGSYRYSHKYNSPQTRATQWFVWKFSETVPYILEMLRENTKPRPKKIAKSSGS